MLPALLSYLDDVYVQLANKPDEQLRLNEGQSEARAAAQLVAAVFESFARLLVWTNFNRC